MFQNHNQNHNSTAGPVGLRSAVLAASAVLALAVGALPAAARPDAGAALARAAQVEPVVHGGDCLLKRVEQQYVRCDDTTGNGVPAPAWTPER